MASHQRTPTRRSRLPPLALGAMSGLINPAPVEEPESPRRRPAGSRVRRADPGRAGRAVPVGDDGLILVLAPPASLAGVERPAAPVSPPVGPCVVVDWHSARRRGRSGLGRVPTVPARLAGHGVDPPGALGPRSRADRAPSSRRGPRSGRTSRPHRRPPGCGPRGPEGRSSPAIRLPCRASWTGTPGGAVTGGDTGTPPLPAGPVRTVPVSWGRRLAAVPELIERLDPGSLVDLDRERFTPGRASPWRWRGGDSGRHLRRRRCEPPTR